jgi:F-type H+-transporting ATPase subunit b
MSMLMNVTLVAGRLMGADDEHHLPIDSNGQITTENAWIPPVKELVIGSLASFIVFALLYKLAGPAIKKSFADRTARIQAELDDSAAAKAAAEAEADGIRAAKGDIDAERSRLYAEADSQAEALLVDGRVRIDAEMVDLDARADAEIASAVGRSGDELRAEIARHSSNAIDHVVNGTLDDSAQQDLIESFISRVGASS